MDTQDLFFEHCYATTLVNVNQRLTYLNNKLNFLVINVRSLRGKFIELVSFLQLSKFSYTFIALTEIALTPNTDKNFEIDGYKSKCVYRNDRGGGIKLFFSHHLNVSILDNLTGIFDSHEALFVECFQEGRSPLTIGVVYRPPDKSVNLFNDYFENCFNNFIVGNCIIGGDFNLNILDSTENTGIRNYITIFQSNGFLNCITLPTYMRHGREPPSSCLDHIWYKLKSTPHSYVITPPLSDHLACLAFFNIPINRELEKTTFRNYSDKCKVNFRENILNESMQFVILNNENVNSAICSFDAWVRRLTNKYFPLKTKILSKKRLNKPWLTTRLIKCIRNKFWLFKMAQQNRISYEMFSTYSKVLRQALQLAEQNFLKNRFSINYGKPKKTWSLVNTLMGRAPSKETVKRLMVDGSMTSDSTAIASAFGDYFYSIPQTIKAEIVRPNLDLLNNVPTIVNSMVLNKATDAEVLRVILSLKRANKQFDLSVVVLKEGAHVFSAFIAKIFNQSITENCYPTLLKIARVVPIYKSGERTNVKNFRPISVLPVLNKIFETLLFKRLNSFVENNSVLNDFQHGFRRGYSTETALMSLLRHIVPAYSDKTYALCLMLDQSKAFDLVEHNLLISKLYRYGLRGIVSDYFKSYLHNRKFYLAYNNTKTEEYAIEHSVPQGSLLGPMLFNLYTNDLVYYVDGVNFVIYADDTVLTIVGPDLSLLIQLMNEKLIKLSEWCRFNGLKLNSSKTKCMIFSPVSLVDVPDVKIDDVTIERVDSCKYLGLTLDSKLKFDCQINELCSRLAAKCAIAFRLNRYFNLDTARKFYFAFVYSIVTYGLSVYGGNLINCSKFNRVQKYQNKIVRTLFAQFYNYSDIDNLYSKLNLLKIQDIYKLKVSEIMHKYIYSDLHSSILDCVRSDMPDANTRNLALSHLYVRPIFPRINVVRHSFVYQFADVWNKVPVNIRNTPDFNAFRKLYISHLLNSY